MNRETKFWSNEVMNYRVKNGLTQQEFAKLAGISPDTVCTIEKIKKDKISVLVISKLVKVLN